MLLYLSLTIVVTSYYKNDGFKSWNFFSHSSGEFWRTEDWIQIFWTKIKMSTELCAPQSSRKEYPCLCQALVAVGISWQIAASLQLPRQASPTTFCFCMLTVFSSVCMQNLCLPCSIKIHVISFRTCLHSSENIPDSSGKADWLCQLE